ncbi:major facilitator superfamily domain-containing protein [Geopyxis carbonaria]|nr:major facilitator superfamily domain-containing protein [Geopyxis carbonaria]
MSAAAASRERRRNIARWVSLGASTAISLAAGTNYVYSAYAPQLGERLHLSAKEINLIGTFGNLGMYLSGIPGGMLVDSKGPRPPILLGAVFLLAGYYPIHLAMLRGLGSYSVSSLCFFSMLTGVGSCLTFGGALKAAALNFPQIRGTATAIALAAFGLSAFFFSTLSALLFPGNSEDFLLVLAIATSGICFVSFFFCQVIPQPSTTYVAVSSSDIDNNRLHRSKSAEEAGSPSRRKSGGYDSFEAEPGTHSPPPADPNLFADEHSSLFSASSDESENLRDAESLAASGILSHPDKHDHDAHIPLLDVRGLALLRCPDFWLLWLVIGTLTGVGLMTINNIGHDAQALWGYFDPEKSSEFVQAQQGHHVSVLSLCSCAGRMISGISSDILYKRHRTPRMWMLILSSAVFIIAQLFALTISNPLNLWLVSALTGLAYGMLFGVSPTIVSETFGINALSTNWGFMTVAAVIFGNVMNIFYGVVYDEHSTPTGNGRQRECLEGRSCYEGAYLVALAVAVGGLVVASVALVRVKALMRARN